MHDPSRFTRRRFLGRAGGAIGTAWALPRSSFAAPASPTVRAAADRFFRDTLDIYPFYASSLGLATPAQATAIETDIFPSGRERMRGSCRRALADIARIDRAALGEGDRITVEIIEFRAKDTLAQLAFPDHLMPVNQMLYGGIFTMAQASQAAMSPFATVADHEHHLQRLRSAPRWCDQAIDNLHEGVRQGIVLPRVLIERMLPMVRGLLDTSAATNPLCAPAKLIPAGASDSDRSRLQAAYEDVLRKALIPATARLLYVLEHDYLPKGRATDGYGALPGGAAWYAQWVRSNTTTAMTPSEVHAVGLAEVARLRGEIKALQLSQGFDGSVTAFRENRAARPSTHPFKTDAEVLAAFRRLDERIGPGLPALFGRVPKAPLDIRLEPELTRDTASDHYVQPAPDGSRPGVYYAVVTDPKRYAVTEMASTFVHEGRPGHHYQIALAQELPLPDLQRFGGDNAYIEGWGLYAETLGYRLGVYDDVDAHLGQLTNAMLRAVRLVVDTGIHADGWPRQRAIDYLMAETGSDERGARAQIERYMVWPGQALGYAIGRLTIERLRDRSQSALGPRFSLSNYHDAVLDQGSVPLAVLDAKIARWAAKAAS